MKKTQEIIGLPIIGILDGVELGNVKSLIVNADDRTMNYIVVDSGMHLLGAKVIHSDRILGISEYAMTVEDENVVSVISKVPAAIELLGKNISVTGAKILTKKGRMAGEVTEVFIDEDDSCRIKGVEYKSIGDPSTVKFLPDKAVITYGKQLVIVLDNFESLAFDVGDLSKVMKLAEPHDAPSGAPSDTVAPARGFGVGEAVDESVSEVIPVATVDTKPSVMVDTTPGEKIDTKPAPKPYTVERAVVAEPVAISPVGPAKSEARTEIIKAPGDVRESAKPVESSLKIGGETEELAEEKAGEPESLVLGRSDEVITTTTATEVSESKVKAGADDEAGLFEERQRRYLLGRKVTKTILDRKGEVIVEEGTEITESIIDTARREGKMVQLVMNNRA